MDAADDANHELLTELQLLHAIAQVVVVNVVVGKPKPRAASS
jgi:hypothetical protein